MSDPPDPLVDAAWSLGVDVSSAAVIDALEAGGVDVLLIKGPVVAALLYTDGTPRPYIDSDLLVPAARLDEARAVLRSRDYVRPLPGDLHGGYAESWRKGDHHVDLHVSLPGTSADPARVWDVYATSSQVLSVAGRRVRTPDLGGTALLLALHAAHHGPVRGEKAVTDLERGVAQLDPSAWDDAADVARQLDLTGMLGWGLSLVDIGTAVADRLDIPSVPTRRHRLALHGDFRVAGGLDDLVSAPGTKATVRLLRTKLLPPGAVVRAGYGAGGGPMSTLRAYARRYRLLARLGPAGIWRFVAAWRQSARCGPRHGR